MTDNHDRSQSNEDFPCPKDVGFEQKSSLKIKGFNFVQH